MSAIAVISAIALSCSHGVASQEPIKSALRSATYRGKTAGGRPVEITFGSARLEGLPYHRADLWGRHVDPEDTWAVTDCKVTVDGKPLFIPLSAYSDIANVDTVNVVPAEQGFELHILGGETGTGYESILTFDGMGNLKKRKTFSRNFPDEAWEETRYSFIQDDGR